MSDFGWETIAGVRPHDVLMDYLVIMDPEESSKHCIAVGISRRLAGYWEKFSISNHHASVDLHRLW